MRVATAVFLPDDDVLLALVTKDATEFRRLDGSTGLTLESIAVPLGSVSAPNYCRIREMKMSGTDAIYVIGSCLPGALARLSLAPLRVDWTRAVDPEASTGFHALRADTSGAYVLDGIGATSVLRKFAALDGTEAWSVERPEPRLQALHFDIDGDLIARLAATSPGPVQGVVEKFSSASGASLWAYADSGSISSLAISTDAILAAGTDPAPSSAETSRGFLARIARTDGAGVWRMEMPAQASGDTAISGLAVRGQDVMAIGTNCRPDPDIENCLATLWHANAQKGTPIHSAPLRVGSAVLAHAEIEDGETTLVGAIEWGENGQQLRLRSYRNTDGEVLRESVHPAALINLPGQAADRLELLRTGDGHVAALFGRSPRGIAWASDSRLMKIDSVSGLLLWERALLDRLQGQTDINPTA